jgi:hypothetical protein
MHPLTDRFRKKAQTNGRPCQACRSPHNHARPLRERR